MKFKGKEIKILFVKFKHKETDGNRQGQTEPTGTNRHRQEQTGIYRNRQEKISDIENYCIIKKFISHVGNLGTNINSYLM